MSYNYDLNPYDELVCIRQCIDELYRQLDSVKRDNQILNEKLDEIYDELLMENQSGGVEPMPRSSKVDKMAVQRQAEMDFPNLKRKSSRAQGILNLIRRGNPPYNS